MASYSDYTYRINGVVSTDKTVMQNIEELANATAAWITYDTHAGLWSAVVNQAEPSVASFDDSNIVGAIAISSSGMENLYNSVRVEFPHIDLRDEKDFVFDSIPAGDRVPNEIDNVLSIQYDVLNDPLQAEYLGLIELKQNRLDKVITFKTDFSQLGLKAGDVIDVTSEVYGFDNKLFRIEKLQESDTDSGNIEIIITAREYSDSVYSVDDLERFTRENSTGIVTMGNIGVPGTPTVSKVERDARPRVTISSTTPTGTVEALEFWYTTDTAILDSNRNYRLLDSVKPVQGNTFPFGNTITISNDGLSSGNLYVKTRGINRQTVGPFSDPAGFVYTPVQTTNSIDENTSVSSTAGLATALGALTLLNNIDQLFSGNVANGSLFTKVFDLFSSNTGLDLRGKANTLSNVVTAAESGVNGGSTPLVTFSGNVSGLESTLLTPWEPATALIFSLDETKTVTLDTRYDFNFVGNTLIPAATEQLAISEIKTSGGNVVATATTFTSLGDQTSDLDLFLVQELPAGDYEIVLSVKSSLSTDCQISGQLTAVTTGLIVIE